MGIQSGGFFNGMIGLLMLGSTWGHLPPPTEEEADFKVALGQSVLLARTTINPIYIDGSCEQTGIMQFVVSDPDTFPAASSQAPLYICLELEKEAVLCETLVWSNRSNPNALTQQPIYLPIQYDGPANPGPYTVTAAPESVSIVRWKAGETQIWLKIQTPGTSWVEADNAIRLRWTIGISGRTSWEQNFGEVKFGRSSMLAASRNVAISDQAGAVSTLICTDLRDASLLPAPLPDKQSLLNMVPRLFDSQTTGLEVGEMQADIMLGNEMVDAFTGDKETGRGYDFNCFSRVDAYPPQEIATLCPENASAEHPGLVKLSSGDLDFFASCGAGWGIHYDSTLRLEAPESAAFGFLVQLDEFGAPLISPDDPSKVLLEPDSLVVANRMFTTPFGSLDSLFQVPTGEYLTRDALVSYRGQGSPLSLQFLYSASVWARVGGPTSQIILKQSLLPTNLDPSEIQDLPPFDGMDQLRRCPASFRTVDAESWIFGQLSACNQCDCDNDYNCDFDINESDLQLMFNQFLTAGPIGDVNQDGIVDIVDSIQLMNQFGSCLN